MKRTRLAGHAGSGAVRGSTARRGWRAVTVALVSILAAASATACSSTPDTSSLPTREPQTAVASPPASVTAAGSVVLPAVSVKAVAVDQSTRTLAALDSGGATLYLLDSPAGASAVRMLPLDPPGTSLTAGRDGTLLVTTAVGVTTVDARAGTTASTPVSGGAVSVVPFADGLAVGTSSGTVEVLSPTGSVTTTIRGLVSVDALASAGGVLTALDRRQTSVTAVNTDRGTLGPALRAGEGATNMAYSRDGRLAVADTGDDELLLFTDNDLILRQRFPVPGSPYGVTIDNTSSMIWVTLTGTNQLVAFDVSTGIPVEKQRVATARQPDSVAVDESSGVVYVGSNAGGGVVAVPSRPTT